MCQDSGKLIADFTRLKSTKLVSKQISFSMGILIDSLIDQEGKGRGAITWVHPQLATVLAEWISPELLMEQLSNRTGITVLSLIESDNKDSVGRVNRLGRISR